MLYEIIVILSQLSKIISGSLVIDNSSQKKNVYKADYCPKMKFCPEGAHVMCMYYDPKSKMGPRCSNAQNISMTPVLASKLLDVSNAVRSRIAQGKEKGKNGDFLPRGYGIFKLKWDSELATFAQVLANQCVLRHDLCRATKRFPDPGQTAGLVRFSYPDWFPVSKSANFTTPGLSSAKLLYATTQILKSWYGQKSSVTPNMITYYPDWTLNPNSQNGRLYLEMIYGSATHMGCGISAYTEYAFYDNNAALNYNSVQIICNYSARPRKGTAVYNTVPPGDTAEPFSRCGCPVGSAPDDDCLCHELPRQPVQPPTQLKHASRKCPDGEVCDPTVVLLPIFTVEDAPPEKLYTHDSFTNTSLRKPIKDAFSIENYLFHNKRNIFNDPKAMKKPQVKYEAEQKQSRSEQNTRPKSSHRGIAVRNRYFDKKAIDIKSQERQFLRGQSAPRKKISVFTRAAKFELPETRIMRPIKPSGVKDVLPRKDFTNAKKLVSKYLYGKNNLMKPIYKDMAGHEKNKLPVEQEMVKIKTDNHMKEVFNIIKATKPQQIEPSILKISKLSERKLENKPKRKPSTETVLHIVEQSIMNQDPFLKLSGKNDSKNLVTSVTEESDNKLMNLLDTLEEEVQHVELRDKDKQVFDAKIRKIYGKVVGKPVSLLGIKSKPIDSGTTKNEQPRAAKNINVITTPFQRDTKTDSKKENPNYWLTNPKSDMKDRKYNNESIARDQKEKEKYEEKSNLQDNKYNMRGIKHSDLSLEQMHSRYHNYERDDEFGDRKTYRNNDFGRNKFDELDEPRHRGIENKYFDEIGYRHRNNQIERTRREFERREDDRRLRNKNYYLNNNPNDDVLSMERRRFYQEKLDNIERRLQMRSHKRRKDKPRHLRPVLSSTRKSDNQMEIYGRARYAHGY